MVGICTTDRKLLNNETLALPVVTDNYEELLQKCDAVYIHSTPQEHYAQVKKAIESNKHVICESPIALKQSECIELLQLAKARKLVLMDSLRTAYSTAFDRMLLLVKGGKIGEVVSIDAVCTSLKNKETINKWNSISAWGPTALLPVFFILGIDYRNVTITSQFLNRDNLMDSFTQIDLLYDNAIASVKVGYGVKAEGELVISGTKGYIYVPAPWWKTDYFEIRSENEENNRRFFYQLDGEGIRNEMVEFIRAVSSIRGVLRISDNTSIAISKIMEEFFYNNNIREIQYRD